MRKKICNLFILLLISMLVLSACASENSGDGTGTPEPTVSVTDAGEALFGTEYPLIYEDDENNVSVIEKEPQRIVSLSPAMTEIIASLGCLDKIAGRTQYCDYPAEVSGIPEVGDMYNVNSETIIGLEPDLVIASAHTNPEVLNNLRSAGLTVVRVFDNDSFDAAYNIIESVGQLLNRNNEAEDLVSGMRAKVEAVVEGVKGIDTPTVYYLSDAGEFGDYGATGDTFISEMIEMAGGINVAKDGKLWVYSVEQLIEDDPYMIVTTTDAGYAALLPSMPGYKDLTAVIEGRVYEMDANIISRVGPRLADGLHELAVIIHEGAYK